jgi:hypothetical protein
MIQHLEGEFEVTSWSEEPAAGLEGTVKVTTARIGQRFSGGIEAETIADMVMTYRPDETADLRTALIWTCRLASRQVQVLEPSHAPPPWNRRPIRKPMAAAPSPMATICNPFLRQSPTRVTAE